MQRRFPLAVTACAVSAGFPPRAQSRSFSLSFDGVVAITRPEEQDGQIVTRFLNSLRIVS